MALTRVVAGNTANASDMNTPIDMMNGNRSDGLAFGSDITGWGANITLNSLPVPAAPVITQGGSVGSTNYTYKVVAVNSHGDGVPSATTQTTTGNATLTGSNYNIVTWTMVQGATNYRVIRTASSGTPSSTGQITTVGNGFPANGPAVTQPTIGTMSFNDTGYAATAYTDSTTNPGGLLTAGAFTQIGTDTILSSSQASISYSSIPATYTHLLILMTMRADSAGTGPDGVKLTFNGDTGANYGQEHVRQGTAANSGGNTAITHAVSTAAGNTANTFGNLACWVYHYADSSRRRTTNATGGSYNSAAIESCSGDWSNLAAAINQITLTPSTGPNWVAGTVVTLFGVY